MFVFTMKWNFHHTQVEVIPVKFVLNVACKCLRSEKARKTTLISGSFIGINNITSFKR